jgi:hypothetical protein
MFTLPTTTTAPRLVVTATLCDSRRLIHRFGGEGVADSARSRRFGAARPTIVARPGARSATERE